MGRGYIGVVLLLSVGAFAIQAGNSSSARSEEAPDCGLHSVKNLSDHDAALIDPAVPPKPTTVAVLRHTYRPHHDMPRGRTPGVETTVYRIRARLIETKHEPDGDFHVVVAGIDKRNPGTMIVELPDPLCTRAATPDARRLMSRAMSAPSVPAACRHGTSSCS